MSKIQFFNTDNQNIGRKRVRSSKSCLLCRQKKIKCDQARPSCGSCLKRGKPELCEYQDHPWSIGIAKPEQKVSLESLPESQAIPTKQIGSSFINNTLDHSQKNKLKTVISKNINDTPRQGEGEVIDFLDAPFPIPSSFSKGCLSWSAVLRKDCYLFGVLGSQKPANAILQVANDTNSDAGFVDKWKSNNPEIVKKAILFKRIGTEFKEEDFVLKLREFLYDTEFCWSLVDGFFESELYAFFPFVDANEYKNELSNLIGQRDRPTSNLQETSDLATIGILLIIMKLTYVFMTYNFGIEVSNYHEPKIQKLLAKSFTSKDISLLISKITEELIDMNPPSVKIFQFLIIEHYYDLYSPEGCSCIDITDAGRLGVLMNYAMKITLNRDPLAISSVLSGVSKFDTPRINLLRRLWYGLILLDYLQYSQLGAPRIISDEIYDTKLPELNPNGVDYLLNKNIHDQLKRFDALKPILKKIINLHNKPSIEEFEREVSNLKEHINTNVKTPIDITNSPHDTAIQRVENANALVEYLDVHSLLYSINFQFFHHYSKRHQNSEACKYLRETIKSTKLLYDAVHFTNPKFHPDYDPQKLFGSGVLVFPKIESALHKTTIVIYATLARIKALKLFTKSGIYPACSVIIDKIINTLYNITNHTLLVFVKASSLYYHTWVISKVHACLLKRTLTIPLGPFYNAEKTVNDAKFVTRLKDFKGYDSGFETFSTPEYALIYQDFLKVWQVCEKDNDNSRGSTPETGTTRTEVETKGGTTDDDFDFAVIFDNDRRWLNRMMGDNYQEAFLGPSGDSLLLDSSPVPDFPTGDTNLHFGDINIRL